MIGKTLAHYEVLSHVGSGGMGEVYRARDTKLGREVALKTLIPEMGTDPERIARLEREAKSLATLQHANIASIYGWEETPDARFLVMELVEGENLAERMARGALSVDESIDIALQITEGLSAAHLAGLVHRDLKPANIMLTSDGQVKILDFGLARAWAGDSSDTTDPSASPTLTAAMTMAGTILGTAAYMSPEQARGHTADRRADIWATGVILWEMLAGRRLFAGETVSDTLAAVLTRDPDLEALPADTSAPVRRGLARCLARDAKLRLHDIADLRLELLAEDDEIPAAGPAAGKRGGWTPLRAGIIAVALAAIAAVAGLYLGRESVAAPVEQVVRMSIDGAGFNGWSMSTISPDGRLVAWVPFSQSGDRSIMVRKLDQFEARVLTGTQDASAPAFSPDGKWLVYKDTSRRSLFKVPVDGGAPQRLVDTELVSETLQWADDGFIYFAGGGRNMADRGVRRVSAGGGEIEIMTTTTVGESQHLDPYLVPGSDWLLVAVEDTTGSSIQAISLGDEQRVLIAPNASTPRFLAPDIVVFYRNSGSTIVAVRVDPKTMVPRGDPITILDHVPVATRLRGCFDLSENGHLIHNHSEESGLVSGQRHLSWIDADNKSTPIFEEASGWAQPRISPDGRHILVRQVGTPNCVLWSYDIARGTRGRITTDVDAHNPLWNPANGNVIFRYDLGSTFYIAERNADGTGETRILNSHQDIEYSPTSISQDGRWLLVTAMVNQRDIWVIDLQEESDPRPLIDSPFREHEAALSPDGQWMSYSSNESGREEVYVVSFPDGNHRQQISIEGGHDSTWSRDGRKLYFSQENRIMYVAVTPGADLQPGLPVTAFTGPIDSNNYNHAYDVMPGGDRLVWLEIDDTNTSAELRVVIGWGDEVREKLGE